MSVDQTGMGLVGAGDIGRLHARVFQAIGGIPLCVCRGANPAAAEALSRDSESRAIRTTNRYSPTRAWMPWTFVFRTICIAPSRSVPPQQRSAQSFARNLSR